MNNFWKNADYTSLTQNATHYTVQRLTSKDLGMAALRDMFPTGSADEFNTILFSTSGVHGTYTTIEEAEACVKGTPVFSEDDDAWIDNEITFLAIQPRQVALFYGVCKPETSDDIAFLKGLRESSHQILSTIGTP